MSLKSAALCLAFTSATLCQLTPSQQGNAISVGLSSSYAEIITEFDQGAEGWQLVPNFLGQTTTPGWSQVANDGEQALQANPVGGSGSQHWKLTRLIDLAPYTTPTLSVKLHFMGHSYQRALVLVGPEQALTLTDYTVLHEQATATASPQELDFDLSAFNGSKVKVMILLQRAQGVSESNVGLYVHKISVGEAPVVSNSCSNPTPLTTAAPIDGDNTTSESLTDGSCVSSQGPEDVYIFTADAAGNYNFRTDNIIGDTVVHIRSTCDDPMTELACDDDSGGGFNSSVNVSLTAGQVVYVYVDSYDGDTGSYTLSASLLP